VQRAAIVSGGNFGVGLLGLLEGEVAGERDDAVEFGVELLESIEVDIGEPLGGELAVFDPLRKLRDGGEGDVFVARGKRPRIDVTPNETILRGCDFNAGEDGIPTSGGR